MSKNKTVVKIGGKEYALSSTDSVEYMHRVALYVDQTMEGIKKNSFHLSTSLAAVLASVNIADTLLKTQDELAELKETLSALKEEVRSLQIAAMNKNIKPISTGTTNNRTTHK
ncbi:MAG: cell division protein ZapA [Christensenellales bacterium]